MPSGFKINWSQYDKLIREKLPSLTVEDFTKQFLPHMSSKAIGACARKLGVKPAKYQLSNEHKIKIAQSIIKETPELIMQIKTLCDDYSNVDLSQKLCITMSSLTRIMKRHNIRRSDRGLERALIASRNAGVGKVPWNKGKKLPPEMLEKMAIGRQRQSGRISQLQLSFYRTLDELGKLKFIKCVE